MGPAVALVMALVSGSIAQTQPSQGTLSGLVVTSSPGTSSVVVTPQVRAELVAHAPDGLRAGAALQLGLRIEHQPHWHTYWKNPGDSGLATQFNWALPPGWQAGDIQWPLPRRLPLGDLTNFGYEGVVTLPVDVKLPPTPRPAGGAAKIRLKASWLVCKDVCIPEEGEFELTLPGRAAWVKHASDFEVAAAAQAREAQHLRPPARAEVAVRADRPTMRFQLADLPAAWAGQALQIFPESPALLHHPAHPAGQWSGTTWTVELPLSAQREGTPPDLNWVLTRVDARGAPLEGLRFTAPVQGQWPDPRLSAQPGSAAHAVEDSGSVGVWWRAVMAALLGGLLLNLMPCVFPVLSLKAVGLLQHAHLDRPGQRAALAAQGLAYSAGVVASFLALATLLVSLRAGGEQIGWGFQLQSPAFVAGLTLLFVLIGLNLAGVFELGSWMPSSVASLQLRHPLADAAFTGVLAVLVASPCTAPFMGAALGWASTWPPAQALGVFGALGLGMAAPYALLTFFPRWSRLLPKPGAWMLSFKTLMAFPMWATALWLLWVLGQQVGLDGMVATLGVALALAMVAWAGGSGHGRTLKILSGSVLVLTLVWAWPSWREAGPNETALERPQASAGAVGRSSAAASDWAPWSEAALQQAQAQGRPVWVDFTAAWCVTCQLNKRTVLSDPVVLAAMAERQVLLLRADWTRRDPQITRALAQLGRNGVPVYALYRPSGGPPLVLSEVLTRGEVLNALNQF